MKSCLLSVALALSCCAVSGAMAHGTDGNVPTQGVTVAPAGDHAIPNIPGKSVRAVLVSMEPGGTNESHRHANSAFIYAYVLEGSIRSQVEGQPARTYTQGEHWVEEPGAHHLASWNTSKTHPAKLLAVFVVDTADTTLTTPDTQR